MNRRDAILRVAGLMGATMSTPLIMGLSNYQKLSSNNKDYINNISDNHKKMIAEISELIIPTTGTPGAKAAKVPEFIILMIGDCYNKKDQDRFFAGLEKLDEASKSKYAKSFVLSKPDHQTAMLKEAETESLQLKKADPKAETPFFPMIKELTLFGYFTSEIGCTKALEYVPIPGSYNGCTTLKPGQKAWAT